MVWSAVNVQSPHAEIKMGLQWGSLVNFGSRGTRNGVAPPPPPESEARISGQKSSHESGPCASHPTVRYRARGPRSGPETGPKIRSPKSGRPAAPPAGIKCVPREWFDCFPRRMHESPCLNWRLCQARQCDLHCWVAVLLRFSGWWFPFAAISAPFCGT